MNIRTELIWSACLLLLGIALLAPVNKSYGQLIAHDSSYVEKELYLESWMIAPFEREIIEEELTVESWMTLPFDNDQETEVEDWMASVWY